MLGSQEQNFSMRTENAKKLARELLHKVQGEQVSVDNGKDNEALVSGDNSEGTSYIEEFSKFSCALISKIINLSTPNRKLKSLKSQRKNIWCCSFWRTPAFVDCPFHQIEDN